MQVNKLLRYGALAVFVGAGVGAAHADDASTSGGIKIKSSDGNFDATIGGRIHFDGLVNMPDHNSHKIGSGAADDANSDFEFRRAFLSLGGHLYGFEYKIDYDLASTGFQDVWFSHSLIGNDSLYIGQHKPWRSLDEIASNNNTVFLERNIVSATGVYGGQDYTEGLYYSWNHALTGGDNLWAGASGYTLHKMAGGNTVRTQGLGYNARLAYAPWVAATSWLHAGVNFSSDNADVAGSSVVSGGNTSGVFTAFSPAYGYGGRSGAKLTLGSYGAVAGGNNPHQDALGAELAGAFGPAYGQAEFTRLGEHQEGKASNNINAYSVTGAWAITGETRGYDKRNATYVGLKPSHAYGAFELAARYDYARNDGHGGSFVGVGESGITSGKDAAGNSVTKDSVSLVTVGLNYYPNPAVRFVFNYTHGEAKLGAAGKDSPDSIGVRAQLVF
jgi:phosphate-selective porin OprO/OprP